MVKNKGCVNESCEALKKKTTYKDSDAFCPKCGSSLVYVCKKCYTQLPDNVDKLCVRCRAKNDDRNDKAKAIAVKVVGAVILTFGKKALDGAKKIKA